MEYVEVAIKFELLVNKVMDEQQLTVWNKIKNYLFNVEGNKIKIIQSHFCSAYLGHRTMWP